MLKEREGVCDLEMENRLEWSNSKDNDIQANV
jgi:hypothetical protein